MGVQIKRVHDPPRPEDGARVLVDRYWPRGIQETDARIDAWMPDLAPSPELIAFFGRKIERWDEFTNRYRKELNTPEARESLTRLRSSARERPLTLLYGARDREHNAARVLGQHLASLPPLPAGMSLPASKLIVPSHSNQITLALRYVPSFAVLEWFWLFLGLAAPLLALLAVEYLAVSGERGWIVFLVSIAALCFLTFIRIFLRERRTGSPEPPQSREGSQSVWVGLATFGFTGIGVMGGTLALVFIFGVLAYIAGVLH